MAERSGSGHSGSDRGGDRCGNGGSDGGAILVGLMAGTVLGAAGLGFWLLRRLEQRRRLGGAAVPTNPRRRSRPALDLPEEALVGPEMPEGELHDKVQRLNLAIEDVRRQLETLGPSGTVHR